MNQHFIARLAIYLLSIIMILFGIYHFQHPRNLLVYVPANLPGGIIWVYIVGAFFILAAISFILNRYVKVAGYLLALMLVIFILTIHVPNYIHAGAVSGQEDAFRNMLKDGAIAAFALHIAGSSDGQSMHY